MRIVTLGAVALVACVAASAQTTVYESKDKAGPVFSDKPSPGAAPVDLPPPNVVSMPKPAAVAPPAAASAPPYRSLVLVSPVNHATVHSNSGSMNISARATPPLRRGDSLRVTIDGQVLPGRYRSLDLGLTASDWGRVSVVHNVEHTLQLAIVDERGEVAIESLPVRFWLRRATVGAATR